MSLLQDRGNKTAFRVTAEWFAKFPRSSGRFFSRIHHEPNTGCWLWAGCTTKYGYGYIKVGSAGSRRGVLAHRVAYALEHGATPEGADLLHSCDEPSCCNPEHLRVGTQAENMRDMWRRGRSAHQLGKVINIHGRFVNVSKLALSQVSP